MSECWDAIVVGAGPAGSAVSIRLAQAGFRVLLVDRARYPRDKLCGEFLSSECWPMLYSLGVGDAVRRSGYQPIRRLQLDLPDRASIQADMSVQADRGAIGLSRERLDEILIQGARQMGVTVAENLEVIALVKRAGRVVGLRARPATSAGLANGIEAMRGKIVIAADGRRSFIVRHSGRIVRASRSTPDNVCAVKRHYRVPESFHGDDAIVLHSFQGGYAGTCRVESGILNLCTLVPARALRGSRGRIDEALRSIFCGSRVAEVLDHAEPVSDWKAIPDVHLQWSRARLDGVLYVGDAMGTVDPLGGEGMGMALEGAMLAAAFAEQAMTSRHGCDQAVQQSYHAAWHSRFLRRIQLCRAFSWLLARPQLLGPLVVRIAGTAWSGALLPFAFRATRGQSDLIGTGRLRRPAQGRIPVPRTAGEHCADEAVPE